MIVFLLLYAYVGATCAALAWGYTDDETGESTWGIVLVAFALWPLLLPAMIIQALCKVEDDRHRKDTHR